MSGQVNVPALAGLLALLVILVIAGVALAGQSPQRTKLVKFQWSLVVGFAVVSFSMVAVTVISEKFITPWMQFAARNHSALISFPLALWAIFSTLYPSTTLPWKNQQIISITYILAVTILLWHVAATHRWAVYLADFRSIQATGHGQLSWKESCEILPDSRRSNFKNMSWPWTNPSMSILLSPQGRVTTVIANPDRGGAWVPFDPTNPQALPRSRFFDYGPYLKTIAAANKK